MHIEEQFVETDLNEILESVLNDFELPVEQKKAIIKSSKLPVIQAIPLQMNQLFHNLLSNGLKFTRPGVSPVINITSRMLSKEEAGERIYRPGSPYCEIIFSDNGIGFNQDFAERIFKIFQRLNGRQEYEGTGIGLALCRKIVLLHHGEIFADSQEDQGTTVHIILPVKQ